MIQHNEFIDQAFNLFAMFGESKVKFLSLSSDLWVQ